jgi:uncharacterized 2Fe-2S/4Fe-4S cluster protein (DUF4445 family)
MALPNKIEPFPKLGEQVNLPQKKADNDGSGDADGGRRRRRRARGSM